MEFEYDEGRSRSNKTKHGIDFVEAQALWSDEALGPEREQRRVDVDFPTWMIESLDNEASRLGVTRQSIIKVWIAERLERKIS